MEMPLILLAAAAMIVLAYFHSQISQLRSVIWQIERMASERIRGLEARVAQLEQSGGQNLQPSAAAKTPKSETIAGHLLNQVTESRPAPPSATEATTHFSAPHVAADSTPIQKERSIPAMDNIADGTVNQIPFTSAAVDHLEIKAQPDIPPIAPPHSASEPDRPEPAQVGSKSQSLEERLGVNWLPKLGISILVIGLASYLAFRLQTMGPSGKVFTGLAISMLLLLGGLFLERKQSYRILARAGISGGWALLFFTTFAMHHMAATRVISSLVLDLVLMLLVAAGMVLHSLRYRSQAVTSLAFLLAFATVATSHLQSAAGSVTFSLIASAVLALGLVFVTTMRHWAKLELAGLVAVIANHFLWLMLVVPGTTRRGEFPLFWESTALILLYWVIFRAAYLLRSPLDAEEDRISSLSAVLTAAGVLGLLKLQGAHPEWTFGTLLALGFSELLLGLWSRTRRRTAYVVLTTIATVLLVAAIPYRFHGVSWPVLWLVQAHVLALCGLRLGEPLFRRLGLLAGFAASFVLAIHDVAPLLASRFQLSDSNRHASLTVGLALAAILFWLHGEVYPRRWPELMANMGDWERKALAATSWLGLGAAATALWVVLATPWIVVGWLSLVVLLGIAADWKRVGSVAQQADVLAVTAIPALFAWDIADPSHGSHNLPIGLAIALYYAGTRRHTVPTNSGAFVAPAYSWMATLLLVVWTGQTILSDWLALVWIVLALALYETGLRFALAFLRWQGFVPAVLAFFLLLGKWFAQPSLTAAAHGWFVVSRPDTFSVLAAVALAYWIQERAHQKLPGPIQNLNSDGHPSPRESAAERWVGSLAGISGTFTAAIWLPMFVPTFGAAETASIAWAALALLLLVSSVVLRRWAFLLHGILLCLWTGLYGAAVSMVSSHAATRFSYQSSLFRLSLASLILFAGLPFAFQLRRACAANPDWAALPAFAKQPEQWFFFVPFGIMIVTLATELRSGNITLGWSLLGLGTFVFALLVQERSFRLAGLSLLLLSVVKIALMDIWTLTVLDRIITMIVMGCALLLVSFLYTRFQDVFRRYL